jgi:hypothetical protein
VTTCLNACATLSTSENSIDRVLNRFCNSRGLRG